METISQSIKTYVIRAGRMTEAQKRNYELLYPKFSIEFKNELLDFTAVFGNNNPVVIEIGFGMGDATSIIAQNNPDINYIAIDVFKAGVGKLLGKIDSLKLTNLRVMEHDAIEVLEQMIPNNSISGFHIFFPDPWQKKKHNKRRLMKKPKIELLAEKLTPGSYIYMVTDWENYAYDALGELQKVTALKNKYNDFAPHIPWRPETGFERKAIKKGHSIYEMFFEKTN